MVHLEPLTPARLGEFRALLGGDEFGGCFCAVWTSHSADWESRCRDATQPNYAITARDVLAGRRAGYFVHDGANVIAWTGAGPKTSFPLLATKLASRLTPSTDRIWSIGCLALRATARGKGMSDAIVRAVVDEAQRSGAGCVEAYPTRPYHEPRSYRGSHTLYARTGFVEAGAERDGEFEIVLMRRTL